MSFVVTARKWRPKKFNEVVGQEHITATLKNAVKNNRIAHAYIFTGPRGVGKTTTARILAKTLNCINLQDFEPCNECEMCLSIQSAQSLDIIEIDGASNRGIDEIRTLRESVKYAPSRGKYKVYIIDEVHMLTKESFNAFLKTLEEPPSHTIFIFATTDIHKVPLTIISRCQRFDFRRIELNTIKQLLGKIAAAEGIEIDDKTLTIIGKKADGALRDAESFFDQIVSFCGNTITADLVSKMLNLIDDEVYFTISDAVISKNFKAVFDVTGRIYENGWNFIDFMDGLLEHFRNIMTVVITGSSDMVETAEVLKEKYMEYDGKFTEGDILRLLNFLSKVQQELRYSQNQRLKIEIALSQLIGLERSSTISSLMEKINSAGFGSTGAEERVAYAPAAAEPAVKTTRSSAEEMPAVRTRNVVPPAGTARPAAKENPAPAAVPEDAAADLGAIKRKWNEFTDKVTEEKRFSLGLHIKNLRLISLEGNKLKVSLSDSLGQKEFTIHQEYLNKTTEAYFGRRLTFVFDRTAAPPPPSRNENDDSGGYDSYSEQPERDDSGNPLISAIKNKLGGREIT